MIPSIRAEVIRGLIIFAVDPLREVNDCDKSFPQSTPLGGE